MKVVTGKLVYGPNEKRIVSRSGSNLYLGSLEAIEYGVDLAADCPVSLADVLTVVEFVGRECVLYDYHECARFGNRRAYLRWIVPLPSDEITPNSSEASS